MDFCPHQLSADTYLTLSDWSRGIKLMQCHHVLTGHLTLLRIIMIIRFIIEPVTDTIVAAYSWKSGFLYSGWITNSLYTITPTMKSTTRDTYDNTELDINLHQHLYIYWQLFHNYHICNKREWNNCFIKNSRKNNAQSATIIAKKKPAQLTSHITSQWYMSSHTIPCQAIEIQDSQYRL